MLIDYEDFLRQRGFKLWEKNSAEAKTIRDLAYKSDRSYSTYKLYLENPESAANMILCLIHQANYLLDQQLRALEKEFLEHGGFTERLYNARKQQRGF